MSYLNNYFSFAIGSIPTLRQSIGEKLREELSVPWSAPSTSSLRKSRFISVPLESGITLPGQKRDCTPQGKT